MSVVKTLLLLLALLCAFHPSPLCEAAVCYVKPTEPHNATCPSEPCNTLDEYVSNSTRYFVSNTVFLFLNGHHDLSSNLIVSDVHNITLEPFTNNSYVVINSELMQSLSFESSSGIGIRDMTLQHCSLRFANSTSVVLTELTAENNAFIMLVNVFGEVRISYFKCINSYNCSCVRANLYKSAVTQSQNITDTVVLLHQLHLSGEGHGVSISGFSPCKIVVMNSIFRTHVGIHVDFDPSSNRDDMLLVCVNTIFYSNSLGLFTGVQTLQHHQLMPAMTIDLHNASFFDNANAMILLNVQNVTMTDCYIATSGRDGGAISVTNSVLSFKGNVTFINNYSDLQGGAIFLSGDSRILIPEPNSTYVLFENNTAGDVGGAIYFTNFFTLDFLYVTDYCRIYIEHATSNVVFNFTNNAADSGGNGIYGAYLNRSCYSPNRTLLNPAQLILNASSFTPPLTGCQSGISSDPQVLCICDKAGDLGDCSGTYYSTYPGQVFDIPGAILGDMNGLLKWPLSATVYPDEFGNELQENQNSNKTDKCADFQYSILSRSDKATLKFPLYKKSITINLLRCPLGFALSSYNLCDCHENLPKNIMCDITAQTIQRQGTTWIGVRSHTNNTILAFSTACPFLYCSTSEINVHVHQNSLLDEDVQCNGNRSGVLCGGCRDNFSLALGSNRCLYDCSNNSLSLFIAFAVAGVALVFFVKFLNLTVSQGTINGLIFYANIVGVQKTVLFPTQVYAIEKPLSVFIAWVNLDLGIETCFFDGMDAYANAWLQFVFPFYVWAITFFIIIISHYSIRASRLFGNNSVPVVATIILLSYSKLLQAVMSALSKTDIQHLNGTTVSVWERDGNIGYLTGKHIPLFVFAVAILILLWFPFTITLVSIQWLQKKAHYKVQYWVTKLMPFFDAFTGPLKSKHRYWVGAMLLARCSLLLIFYIYTAHGSGVAFMSIVFVSLLILVFLAATTSVYRNYYMTVLELSYILNLGILATASLFVQYLINKPGSNDREHRYQDVLAITSVGIAFLQFVATVVYHAYMQLKKPLKKLKNKVMSLGAQEGVENRPEREHYEPIHESSFTEQPMQRPPFQDTSNSKFRESLFEYLSD